MLRHPPSRALPLEWMADRPRFGREANIINENGSNNITYVREKLIQLFEYFTLQSHEQSIHSDSSFSLSVG